MNHSSQSSEKAVNESHVELWTWAIEKYSKPGIADMLINCQDQFSMNVNILLWCCWCADENRLLSNLEIRNALEIGQSWADEITTPIRRARRALKMPQFRDHATGELGFYEKMKGIELESEKLELELYQAIPGDAVASKNIDIPTIARKNITAYVAMRGIARHEGFSISIIEDVVNGVFGDVQT